MQLFVGDTGSGKSELVQNKLGHVFDRESGLMIVYDMTQEYESFLLTLPPHLSGRIMVTTSQRELKHRLQEAQSGGQPIHLVMEAWTLEDFPILHDIMLHYSIATLYIVASLFDDIPDVFWSKITIVHLFRLERAALGQAPLMIELTDDDYQMVPYYQRGELKVIPLIDDPGR